MRLFDTHAHIGLITEDPIEQPLTVQEAKQESVEGIVSICNNLRDFYQIYPNLKDTLPSYWPATFEIFMIGGVIAAFLLAYTFGEMFLLKEQTNSQA